MSTKITQVTRRDVFNVFINGFDIDSIFENINHTSYSYNGSLTEIDFLSRLYNLKEKPSNDPRYKNAEIDIHQHTVNNTDYENGWVFNDERFPLKNGNDEDLLNFLCKVFHPEVRDEKQSWKECLDEVNRLLANDDFELYPIDKISNHDVYGWRIKSKAESTFIPFSLKNKKYIDTTQIKFSIKRDCREQIIKAIEAFDQIFESTTETGLTNYSKFSEEAFKELSSYYEPKCYKENGYDKSKFTKAENIYEFIKGTRPYCIFDAIEIFSNDSIEPEFSKRINEILLLNKLPYFLKDRIVQANTAINIPDNLIGLAPEVGVKELLQNAQTCYINGDKENAVEKLWDAYERLKTIYNNTDCDKRQSISKIIDIVSKGDVNYRNVINSELLALTDIGNKFRIRHHETDKIDINDERYYNYFYTRCVSSISLILDFINKEI